MNVSVITLGCKANQAESSLIECALRSRGINITSRDENSDFCIINTCTVTAKSDYQSRQEIRRAVRSGAAVIVTGCYSELHKKEIEAMQDGVKLFDNKNKLNIIDLFNDNASDSTLNNKLSFQHSEKSRYFLKIQDGCTKTEEPVAGDPPYMGLRYFDTQDADLFYGREGLTCSCWRGYKRNPSLPLCAHQGAESHP